MKNQKLKKILNVVFDIVLIFIMVVAIFITVMTFSSKASNNGVANLFGYSPFAVQSDSMVPTFKKGDMIISKTKDFDPVNLKVGDIITFYSEDSEKNLFINSHRIVKVEPYDETNSYVFYTTRGDAYDYDDIEPVGSSNVIGVYTGTRIPFIGSIMDFLQTQTGFLVCVLIPLALLFIWQLYKLFTILIENKKVKILNDTESKSIDDISDEDKRRIAEEYLKNHPSESVKTDENK